MGAGVERGTEPGKGARKEGREEGMGGVGVGVDWIFCFRGFEYRT